MRKAPVFTALAVLAAMHAPDTRAADVVVSLKPIHSLVAGVMGDTGEPRLLLGGAASPHTYQMRPSEARVLSEADLIVWIGEAMETFLERPIANLGSQAEIVTLHEAEGLRLLPNREGGLWEDHDLEVHVDEHDDHGHDHDEFNMHVWLDPFNARLIVGVVADALERMDPDRADTYRGNAKVMRDRVTALESSLLVRLEPVRRRAFIVFHDAYRYFEFAFGLNGKGAVSLDPARPPGVKRLAQLRAALDEQEIRCIFTEPQFEPDLVSVVVEGTDIRIASLDPLGVDLEPGPDAWFEIVRGVGDAIANCLGED